MNVYIDDYCTGGNSSNIMLPITEIVVIKKPNVCLIKVNLIVLFSISNFRHC